MHYNAELIYDLRCAKFDAVRVWCGAVRYGACGMRQPPLDSFPSPTLTNLPPVYSPFTVTHRRIPHCIIISYTNYALPMYIHTYRVVRARACVTSKSDAFSGGGRREAGAQRTARREGGMEGAGREGGEGGREVAGKVAGRRVPATCSGGGRREADAQRTDGRTGGRDGGSRTGGRGREGGGGMVAGVQSPSGPHVSHGTATYQMSA